jgi:putative membrane protein insertion efficiency factor
MKRFVLKLIVAYQKTKFFHQPILKSLFLSDAACRFKPSCAEYCYQAIEKYGIIKGGLLGLRRIFKCHPWSKGGKDPLK